MTPSHGLAHSSSGFVNMTLSAFSFSVMTLLVRLAGERIPLMEVVFARALVTLLLSWWMLRMARVPPWGTHRASLILRGVLGTLALTCFYYSVIGLGVSNATVIHFVNPIFTAILAAILLREQATWLLAIALAGAFGGVVLVAQPTVLFESAAGVDPFAVAIALAGALLSATAYITVRRLADREHPLVIVFYFPLVALPLTLPFGFANWIWPSWIDLLILLGVGISTQAGQLFLTRGLHQLPAGRAMAIGYLQVPFAFFWDLIALGSHPNTWSLLGAGLILASASALRRPYRATPTGQGVVR